MRLNGFTWQIWVNVYFLAVLEEKKVVRQERAKEYAKKKEEKFKSKKEQNKKAAELKKNDTKVPKEKAKPKKVVKQHTPGQKYKKEWNTHDESL